MPGTRAIAGRPFVVVLQSPGAALLRLELDERGVSGFADDLSATSGARVTDLAPARDELRIDTAGFRASLLRTGSSPGVAWLLVLRARHADQQGAPAQTGRGPGQAPAAFVAGLARAIGLQPEFARDLGRAVFQLCGGGNRRGDPSLRQEGVSASATPVSASSDGRR